MCHLMTGATPVRGENNCRPSPVGMEYTAIMLGGHHRGVTQFQMCVWVGFYANVARVKFHLLIY